MRGKNGAGNVPQGDNSGYDETQGLDDRSELSVQRNGDRSVSGEDNSRVDLRARVTLEVSMPELEKLEQLCYEANDWKLARRMTLLIPGLKHNLNRAYADATRHIQYEQKEE